MIKTIDFAILDFLQEFLRNPILDNIFCVITWLGNSGMIWICCGMIFLFFKKTRIMGISLLISLTIGFLIGEVWIKPMIGRTRPFTITKRLSWQLLHQKVFHFRRVILGHRLREQFPFGYIIDVWGLLH